MKALKNVGIFAAVIALLLVPIAVLAIFLLGAAYVTPVVTPILIGVSWLAFAICVLILLPLAFFRYTRPASAIGFMIASFIFGASLWFYGFFLAFGYWGYVGIIFGIMMGGIGVVPVAFLAAVVHGAWMFVCDLTIFTVVTFVSRAVSLAIAHKADDDAARSHMNMLLAENEAVPYVAPEF
ncbi:MAG TPA: hypothetical protein VMF67_04615 [Rhizomicrobium sp.]|nr:hypothetical protein [Rhizomicrobium sp.]